MSPAGAAFEGREWRLAILFAVIVQIVFFSLLAFFGDSRGSVRTEEVPQIKEIPIAVQPVLDELPLLKLGSKQKAKPRLPDMWKKRAPVPVKRYEERSAPSAEAKNTVEDIPKSKLADKDHEAPPEDAEIVKELEQDLEEPDEDQEAPEYDEEGAADGSEFGTETDPLKARQVDLYRSKIASWFNARFKQPTDQIPCDQLKKLAASVSVSVGSNRNITGFSVTSPSGNATFDARVQSTMSALVGEQLPPPPPLYPDILGTTLSPLLSGKWAPCQVSAAPAQPSPDDAEPVSPPAESQSQQDVPNPTSSDDE